MTDRRKILEIGPGPNPMHHLRAGKGVEPFTLQGGDDYTALDSNNVFNTEIWTGLGSKYRDQIHALIGDRENMPFADGEFDEIVALGTLSDNLEEVNRVIKKGGLLRVGTTDYDKNHDKIDRLQSMGYKIIDTQHYDYQPIQKWKPTPYTVILFQKTE